MDVQALIPDAKYEVDKLKYVKEHIYNPDFTVAPNLYIEAKGRFESADRAKHLAVKEQHPEVQVIFVFGKPLNTLSKQSKTTYADWCEQHGFRWTTVEKGIPKAWLPKTRKSKKDEINNENKSPD